MNYSDAFPIQNCAFDSPCFFTHEVQKLSFEIRNIWAEYWQNTNIIPTGYRQNTNWIATKYQQSTNKVPAATVWYFVGTLFVLCWYSVGILLVFGRGGGLVGCWWVLVGGGGLWWVVAGARGLIVQPNPQGIQPDTQVIRPKLIFFLRMAKLMRTTIPSFTEHRSYILSICVCSSYYKLHELYKLYNSANYINICLLSSSTCKDEHLICHLGKMIVLTAE